MHKNISFPILDVLRKRAQDILNDELTPSEYLRLAKVNVKFQQTFDSNPVFQECFNRVVESNWDDAQIVKGLANLISSTGYCCSKALEKVSQFICDNANDVPLKFVDQFLSVTYLCGTDHLDAFPVAAQIIERFVFLLRFLHFHTF